MIIDSLEIQGYRSLKDVSWKPGNLNIVIGPNGAGKSNLLRLCELISLAAMGRLSKYIQSQGGMEPLLWDGISSSLCLAVKMLSSGVEKVGDRDVLTYQLELARLGKGSSYIIDREMLEHTHLPENGSGEKPSILLERNKASGHIFVEDQKILALQPDSIVEDETLLSSATGFFMGNRVISACQKYLSSWTLYHDLAVNRDSAIRQPHVAHLEKIIEPDGQNLIPVLHTLYTGDREFKKEINNAMAAAFGDDFEELLFPPAADQRIQMRVRWRTLKREQSAADLSDGTLRFLLLLTILANPSAAPLIAIDEPETGLHPSMFPIIAEFALEASRRSQVILTTHSPQFLDAFKNARLTTTIAQWENGETKLTIPDQAELDYWLREYSLGSLFNSGELEGMI